MDGGQKASSASESISIPNPAAGTYTIYANLYASPNGLVSFWDPGSFYHWRKLYIPGPRADAFARVDELIPADARVASTDYVHTRPTHRERSYDYSNYLRKVSGYERRVPEDTQFICHRHAALQQRDS